MVIVGEKGADVGVVGAASSVGTYGRLASAGGARRRALRSPGLWQARSGRARSRPPSWSMPREPVGGVGERNPAGPGRLAPPPARSPAPPVSASWP